MSNPSFKICEGHIYFFVDIHAKINLQKKQKLTISSHLIRRFYTHKIKANCDKIHLTKREFGETLIKQ